MFLPEEIIIDILCGLGVEDLLRFRCVSKQFRSLIDDPDFIKLHVSRSIQTNTNLSLIFEEDNHLYCADFESLKKARKQYKLVDKTHVLGSCNGLMALLNSSKEICVWNRSTRKSHLLPSLTEIDYDPNPPVFKKRFYYGFGYDPVSDDYKLVQIMGKFHHGDTMETEVMVYSLRNNSWRKIKKDFPFDLNYFGGHAVFASHALHWVGRNKSQRAVVSIDLVTEEYRVVPLPDGLGEYFPFNMTILGGFLCLTTTYSQLNVIDIWIMEEYGVKESWTKLLLSLKDIKTTEKHQIDEVLPMAYSKTRDKLLILEIGFRRNNDYKPLYSKFFWYDLITSKKVKRVRIKGAPKDSWEPYISVQSLVDPSNPNGFGWCKE